MWTASIATIGRRIADSIRRDGTAFTIRRLAGRVAWIVRSARNRRLWRSQTTVRPIPCPEKADGPRIRVALANAGFLCDSFVVDVADFRGYVEAAGYPASYYGPGTGYEQMFVEKALEHYVSLQLLGLSADDALMDVACFNSPFSRIVTRRFGTHVWRQDMMFPPGVAADRIGSDAAAVPLPDMSISAMTLHCSFEHFEGTRDTEFLREAARLLRPGGRLCILPVYLNQQHNNKVEPAAVSPVDAARFADEAPVVLRADYGNRHGRFYDPAAFVRRVLSTRGTLDVQLFYVENADEVAPTCYLRFAALFRRPG